MLRRLYDWCIASADKPYAVWILGLVSFAESSFFPVPPDVMLIPMALAQPRKRLAVRAGLHGHLGRRRRARLRDRRAALRLRSAAGSSSSMATATRSSVPRAYAEYGAWIILLKGFTPIPYKLVTITSGFAAYSLPLFILFSVITRGARFYLLAFLLNRYGPQRARDHRGAAGLLGDDRRDRARARLHPRLLGVLSHPARRHSPFF